MNQFDADLMKYFVNQLSILNKVFFNLGKLYNSFTTYSPKRSSSSLGFGGGGGGCCMKWMAASYMAFRFVFDSSTSSLLLACLVGWCRLTATGGVSPPSRDDPGEELLSPRLKSNVDLGVSGSMLPSATKHISS